MIRRALHRALRRAGLVTGWQEQRLADFSEADIRAWAAVRPFTMTSPERVLALREAVRYVVAHDIPGAIVECGVWRGGSIMAVAYALQELDRSDRDLYLFDTFTGMPPAGELDVDRKGRHARDIMGGTDAYAQRVAARCTLEDTRRNVLSTGYPADRIRFVVGKVEDTVPRHAPPEIAILRLDTDWYESTKHGLVHLYPRLVPGGLLLLDDYGHWRGARRATDEFMRQTGVRLFLHRVDYTARLAIRPACCRGHRGPCPT